MANDWLAPAAWTAIATKTVTDHKFKTQSPKATPKGINVNNISWRRINVKQEQQRSDKGWTSTYVVPKLFTSEQLAHTRHRAASECGRNKDESIWQSLCGATLSSQLFQMCCGHCQTLDGRSLQRDSLSNFCEYYMADFIRTAAWSQAGSGSLPRHSLQPQSNTNANRALHWC